MQIEQSYDKVVLTHDDVQNALRKLVEEKTGRKVRGDIWVEMKSVNPVHVRKDCPRFNASGFCWLEPAVPAPMPYVGG